MSNGPEDFVSFSDYLGLNDEAGQQMTERAMAGSDKLRSAAMAAPDAIYNAAVREVDDGAGGTAAFERTREQARTGLASYSDFMRGMADPAERQAMMAKAYGGASVSRFDSMLAGEAGGGRIAAGRKDAQSMGTQFESRLMDADARRASDASRIAAQSVADESSREYRQAEVDAREKNRLGLEWELRKFDNDYASHIPGKTNRQLSRREREIRMDEVTRSWGGDTTGKRGWDAHNRAQEARTQGYYDNRPKGFWGGEIDLFGPKPTDPSTGDTWAKFYNRSKRTGAK